VHDILLVISLDSPCPQSLSLIELIDFCKTRVLIHPLPDKMLGSNGKGQDPVLIVKRHWVWLLVQISGPSTSQLEETKVVSCIFLFTEGLSQ